MENPDIENPDACQAKSRSPGQKKLLTGKKLRQIRKLLKLSQTEFGARICASVDQIGSWERGEVPLPRWAVQAIKREFLASKEIERYRQVNSNKRRELVLVFDKLLKTASPKVLDHLRRQMRLLFDLTGAKRKMIFKSFHESWETIVFFPERRIVAHDLHEASTSGSSGNFAPRR